MLGRGKMEGAFDEDGIVDVEGEVGVLSHGRGEAVEVLRVHGEAVGEEPGAEMLGAGLVDGAGEEAPIISGVVAEVVVVAMDVQHDRWGRGTHHRRRWRRGHAAGDGGRPEGAEEGPLGVGAELAETHGRSGASGHHDLMMMMSSLIYDYEWLELGSGSVRIRTDQQPPLKRAIRKKVAVKPLTVIICPSQQRGITPEE